MALVRYGTNVFELDDVYGLDLYQRAREDWRLKVVLRGGTESFEMRFENGNEARQAFETVCDELDIQELGATGHEGPH